MSSASNAHASGQDHAKQQIIIMDKEHRKAFLRKLHSLCGVVPLGVFLCFHMLVNYSANWGSADYNAAGYFLAHMPYKILLETFVIFLPLLFHGIYGIYLAVSSNENVISFRYGANWRFLFQRVTGIIAFLFVTWHIYGTKLQVELHHIDPSFGMVAAIVANPLGFAFFLVGILCCIYHFCNGLWTFLITWGITITPRSQQITLAVCVVFFIVFAVFGTRAILAFV